MLILTYTQVYDDLEALGTSKTCGWKPLREVVRAHGVRLVIDAIEEYLIKPSLAQGLAILCVHREAYEEGRAILGSMLRIMKPLPKPRFMHDKLFDRSIALRTMALWYGISETDSCAFTYHQLVNLFSSGVLPLEWIACQDLTPLWDRMIISITQGDGDAAEAAMLVKTVVAVLYSKPANMNEKLELLRRQATQPGKRGRKPKTRNTADPISGRPCTLRSTQLKEEAELRAGGLSTIDNLLTVLNAVTISKKSSPICLREMAIEARQVQQFYPSDSRYTKDVEIDLNQLRWTIFACSLIDVQNHERWQASSQARLIDLDDPYWTTEDFICRAALYVCHVASCCGRTTSEDSFITMKNLLKDLDRLFQRSDNSVHQIHNRIALHAAFRFAEGTGQPMHLQWAVEMERMAMDKQCGKATRTPIRKACDNGFPIRNGYRWEDGICEWVAKTPAGTNQSLKGEAKPEVEAEHPIGHEDDAVEHSRSSITVLSPNVSPCLRRSRQSPGDQDLRGSRRMEDTINSALQYDTDSSKGPVTTRQPDSYSDAGDTSYDETDELSVSPTSISATCSQQSVAAPQKTKSRGYEKKPPGYNSLGGSQGWKTVKSTSSGPAELDESEDELSFS